MPLPRRHRPPRGTPPRSERGERLTATRAEILLLAWAFLVVVTFLIQPSTTDVVLASLFLILGGGR